MSESLLAAIVPLLTAEQLAQLAEITGESLPAPAPNGAFTPSEDHLAVYKGWIKPREAYNLLHPIAKKGTCEARAILNSLPVTGTVSVRGLKKGWRGKLERGGVARVGEKVANGKIISSVYAQRTNADGKSMDGRAPEFFKAGGKLVIDERTKTASLVLPSGFKFSAEQIAALEEAIG